MPREEKGGSASVCQPMDIRRFLRSGDGAQHEARRQFQACPFGCAGLPLQTADFPFRFREPIRQLRGGFMFPVQADEKPVAPGASSVWSGNENLLKRLRLFERDSAVISPENPTGTDSPLPSPEQQLRHALPARRPPIPGVLLAPARMWEAERIFFGNGIPHTAFFIYQKKLAGRSAKVDTNIQHRHTSCCLFQYTAAAPCSL